MQPSKDEALAKLGDAAEAGRKARDAGRDVAKVRELLVKARAAFEVGDYETAVSRSDSILSMLHVDPYATTPPSAMPKAPIAPKQTGRLVPILVATIGFVLVPVGFLIAYVSVAGCGAMILGLVMLFGGIFMSNPRGRASQAELMRITVIHPAESALGTWWGRARLDPSPPITGYALLTSERLVFITDRGSERNVQNAVELQDISGVSGPDNVGKVVLSVTREDKSVEMAFLPRTKTEHREPREFADAIRMAIHNRLAFLEQEKRRARVQYLLDFSFLKAKMEQGGLSVMAIKCPSCGSPLELPESGNRTTCRFCGSQVQAQDIFERLRGLIGDLPQKD